MTSIADITVGRSPESGQFGYTLHITGSPVVHCGGGFSSATEVVWRALDIIREDDSRHGMVAIYSVDGRQIALAPLWAVPAYDRLDWRPLSDAAVLTSLAFTDREPTQPGEAVS